MDMYYMDRRKKNKTYSDVENQHGVMYLNKGHKTSTKSSSVFQEGGTLIRWVHGGEFGMDGVKVKWIKFLPKISDCVSV